MIPLFASVKSTVDVEKFDHLLHGSVVKTFEERFANYVGAKYAVSINSCTNAIFLLCKYIINPRYVQVPAMIPPVVINAIIQSYDEDENPRINIYDDPNWVGGSYELYDRDIKVIDSAQEVTKNQYSMNCHDNDIILYSFYPTKPIQGMDGGMIVSNDYETIEYLRTMTMNGAQATKNSWEREYKFPGWKMYMNSTQATIALSSLLEYDERLERLNQIRQYYNDAFGLNNTSNHLYRINVRDNESFIKKSKEQGIVCGKHYTPVYKMDAYASYLNSYMKPGFPFEDSLPACEKADKETVSIPFNHELSANDIVTVIKFVEENR